MSNHCPAPTWSLASPTLSWTQSPSTAAVGVKAGVVLTHCPFVLGVSNPGLWILCSSFVPSKYSG